MLFNRLPYYKCYCYVAVVLIYSYYSVLVLEKACVQRYMVRCEAYTTALYDVLLQWFSYRIILRILHFDIVELYSYIYIYIHSIVTP